MFEELWGPIATSSCSRYRRNCCLCHAPPKRNGSRNVALQLETCSASVSLKSFGLKNYSSKVRAPLRRKRYG